MKKAIFAAGAVAALIGTLGSGSAFAVSNNTAVISGGSAFDICIATNGAYTGSSFAADIVGSGFETQLVYDDFTNEACKNVTLPAGNNTISMRKTSGMDVTSWTIAGNKLTFTASETSSSFLRSSSLMRKSTPASVVEVSFNANGGTGSMSPVSGDYTSAITLSANTLTKADYVFDSWNTKADGSGTSYADGASINFAQGGEVTLYAQWRASVAVLGIGTSVNAKLKNMAGTVASDVNVSDYNIKAVKTANTLPTGFDVDDSANIISDPDSLFKIHAWFDNTDLDGDGVGDGIVYVYTQADSIRSGHYMNSMFKRMYSLADISALAEWDTSQVYSMRDLFSSDSSLVDISALAGWNTSNVRDMGSMLGWTGVKNLNALETVQHPGNNYISWDVSNVTNMGALFVRDPLEDISALASWNTSNVRYMNTMLFGLRVTSLAPLETKQHPGKDYVSWDVSKVEDINTMFGSDYNSILTDISALSSWDTSSVKDMSQLFVGGVSIDDISALASWNTSKVENMRTMFRGVMITNVDALETKQHPGKDYVSWDVSNVKNMSEMLVCSKLTDISALASWNTSKVEDMSFMFYSTRITNVDALETKQYPGKDYVSWDVSNVLNMAQTFSFAKALEDISALASWNTSKVENMHGMFYGNTAIKNVDALETVQYTDKDYVSWDVSAVKNMGLMFSNPNDDPNTADAALEDISALSSWDISSVEQFNSMFDGDDEIMSLSPLFGWVIDQNATMVDMFKDIPASVQRPSWYQQ